MSDITLENLNEKLEKILSLLETEKTKQTEFDTCLPLEEVECKSCDEVIEVEESVNDE